MVKANSGQGEAVMTVYRFLYTINPDLMSIHNIFSFDIKHIATFCAEMNRISDTFDKRWLGNVRVSLL